MPCTWTGTLDGDTIYHYKQELDRLASTMCDQCEVLEFVGRSDLMTRSMAEWWEQHKKADVAKSQTENILKIVGTCEDCGMLTAALLRKSDHHGGTKVVCIDRNACHARGG